MVRRYRSVVAHDAKGLSDAKEVLRNEYQRAGLLTGDGGEASIDVLNGLSTTTHFVVYCEDEPVATARLLQPNRDIERVYGWAFGLELGAKYHLESMASMSATVAEVTRLAVRAEYRATAALATLCRAIKMESERRGIKYWIAGSTMSSDHEEDARIAATVAVHKRLFSAEWQVAAQDLGVCGAGRGKRFYDAAAQAKAREGRWDALRLPPILQLYSLRMGARFMGEPTYDSRFAVYSLPLIVAVSDLRFGSN